MSTSGTSLVEENAHDIALLKEQMAEMMRMMQQLVVGGGHDSSSPTLEGLGLKMRRNHYHPNHDGTTLPVGQ